MLSGSIAVQVRSQSTDICGPILRLASDFAEADGSGIGCWIVGHIGGGTSKSIVALGHNMLRTIYAMIRSGTHYKTRR